MEKQDQDKQQEEMKNSSDSFMSDYLINYRKGLEAYKENTTVFMNEYLKNMDKSYAAIMENVNFEMDAINKRMQELGTVAKQTMENVEIESPKETEVVSEGQTVKKILNQITLLVAALEKVV